MTRIAAGTRRGSRSLWSVALAPTLAAQHRRRTSAARRRRARTSARSRRTTRRPADRIGRRTARRPTTSSASSSASARSRLPGARTFGCPSSSRPARRTAAPIASTDDRRRRAPVAHASTGANDVQRALVLGQRRGRGPPVVFAGYGIVVPESQDFGYDSYATLDVKDKVVVVLRYFPEDADQKTKGILARYSDLRYKAMAARQRGAQGMLVVTGPRSPNAGETIPMTFDTALAGSGIVAASISGAVAAIGSSAAPGRRSKDAQRVARLRQSARRGLRDSRPASHDPCRPSSARSAPATTSPATCRRPPPERPRRSRGWRSARTTITWAAASTATRWPPRRRLGKVHFGADDNASGTAAVLAIGERLAAQAAPPERAAAVLVGRRDRPDRLDRLRQCSGRRPSISSRRTSTSTWSGGCRTTS